MKGILSVYLISIMCLSCSSDKKIPPDVIPSNQMKLIIWDMMNAEQLSLSDTAFVKSVSFKNKTTPLYQKVFAIHHINKTAFYKSFAYYEGHSNLFKTLMDSVSLYANKKRTDLYNRRK